MKRIIYFILAVVTIGYIGFLCYINIVGTTSTILNYISVYGGLAIALAYAAINFIGNPLKVVFFILLLLATIVLVLTIITPEIFRNLFGIIVGESAFINLL